MWLEDQDVLNQMIARCCRISIGEDLLGESNPLDGVTHRGLAEK
jgi:hypothetical protein